MFNLSIFHNLFSVEISSIAWPTVFIIITFALLVNQSERFFSALKGHGVLTRLVLLPLESHGYEGHESVMHCLWEMDRWLQKHCVNAETKSESTPSSQDQSDEAKAATTGGGSAPECFNSSSSMKSFMYGIGPLSSL
jgi:acetyl esterase/lipase